MLGPAELREIYDALHGMGLQPVRLPEGRSPYLSPAFAAGMAMTKALRKPVPAGSAVAAPTSGDAAPAK
ncbi:hypothetical protein [Magnetospirillum sp. SS-4]|uniref:hypothetical protein n=1 Tax=Magnetospirillum sp. SS-4 TaxID=2681465 RepID=UPI001382CC34|nr:hypothetical protein [Magnetospirillum sp. SS-4]CAA7620803.1 conserved hypothetical protein [Magnetospirillum sp. SS-4]